MGRGMISDIAACTVELQVMLFGQSCYKAFVIIGVESAQLVIEMNHRQDNSDLFAEIKQQAQQCDGVCTAGDRRTHAIASLKQPMLSDISEDGLL